MLGDLCRLIPKERISIFISTPKKVRDIDQQARQGVAVQFSEACNFGLPKTRFGRIGKLCHLFVGGIRERSKIRRLVQRAYKFGAENQVDLVCAVLESPTIIQMTKKVAQKLDKPFSVIVWDDVDHLLFAFGIDRVTQRYIRRTFCRLVGGATAVAVIGEAMQEEYRARFGAEAVIVRHGIQSSQIVDRLEIPEQSGSVRIGFAGSVTAKSAFNAFIEALDRVNWKLEGRDITLCLTGLRFVLSSHASARVEYLGWRATVAETVRVLSDCDFNYLPQPFEEGLSVTSRLSFPAKLTTYLAAGRPVFLHCPRHASLFQFHQRYPFGVVTDSLDSEKIISTMRHLLNDSECYSDSVRNGRLALTENLTEEKFKSSLATFIGVDSLD